MSKETQVTNLRPRSLRIISIGRRQADSNVGGGPLDARRNRVAGQRGKILISDMRTLRHHGVSVTENKLISSPPAASSKRPIESYNPTTMRYSPGGVPAGTVIAKRFRNRLPGCHNDVGYES